MVSGPGCGGVGWGVVGGVVVVVTLSKSEAISGNGSDVNSSSSSAVVSVVVVIIAIQERRSVRYRNGDDGILRLLCVIFLISIKILSLL